MGAGARSGGMAARPNEQVHGPGNRQPQPTPNRTSWRQLRPRPMGGGWERWPSWVVPQHHRRPGPAAAPRRLRSMRAVKGPSPAATTRGGLAGRTSAWACCSSRRRSTSALQAERASTGLVVLTGIRFTTRISVASAGGPNPAVGRASGPSACSWSPCRAGHWRRSVDLALKGGLYMTRRSGAAGYQQADVSRTSLKRRGDRLHVGGTGPWCGYGEGAAGSLLPLGSRLLVSDQLLSYGPAGLGPSRVPA